MNNVQRVEPWARSDSEARYDAVITACGYESRSINIAEAVKPHGTRRLAFGFRDQKVLAYHANRSWYTRAGFTLSEVSDSEFAASLDDQMSVFAREAQSTPRFCVDISSMTRFRIAAVFDSIAKRCRYCGAIVDFLYSRARYVSPPREMAEILEAGPVMPEFAGWPRVPEWPTVAIVGLGYERDKAIGALDYLEPAETWAFQAVGGDKRFESDVEKANFLLWQVLGKSSRLKYRVDQPFDCFVTLESLTAGVLRHARPVLLPFGPKLFALCSLVVASVHSPHVGVWRVSSGINEEPVDRQADGTISGLRVTFAGADD